MAIRAVHPLSCQFPQHSCIEIWFPAVRINIKEKFFTGQTEIRYLAHHEIPIYSSAYIAIKALIQWEYFYKCAFTKKRPISVGTAGIRCRSVAVANTAEISTSCHTYSVRTGPKVAPNIVLTEGFDVFFGRWRFCNLSGRIKRGGGDSKQWRVQYHKGTSRIRQIELDHADIGHQFGFCRRYHGLRPDKNSNLKCNQNPGSQTSQLD